MSPERSMTPEHLAALRRYSAERLMIRSETEVRSGGITSTGFSHHHRGMGWHHSETFTALPPVTTRGWGVYRGPVRLDVPSTLEACGDLERKRALDAEIHRARRASKVWLGTAMVGGAGLVTGVALMNLAEDEESWRVGSNVALGGITVSLTGLLGASFPSAKASRLTRSPAAVLGLPEAQRLVDGHNERLRTSLNLTPEEVWQIESQPSRR